jgi:copper(I)-binding protein
VRASRLTTVLVTAAALAAGGLALASCGGSDESTGTTTDVYDTTTTQTTTQTETAPPMVEPTVVRIVVENGQPKGGIVRKTVTEGDRLVLVVKSDVADEVHVHGYDVIRDVAAGGTARIPFRATIPGRFEVELEQRGLQIADLTVQP